MPTRTNSVLIVIDVQGKLADAVQRSELLQENVRKLIEAAHILDIPILVTEQYPKGLGHTVPLLSKALADAPVIEKTSFSCCGALQFEHAMMELHKTDVILCGIEAHVCVYQTARDLLARGYNVHLVSDAVSSRTEENRHVGIHAMERRGAVLTSTEMLLFELLEESGTEMFKKISSLVK